jgi:hypothetical protein
MRGVRGLFSALPLACWLLAGCTDNVTPTYHGPVATNPSAATITVSVPSENYSVSQNSSWIQIAAIDGKATGRVQSVVVSTGEHRITVRHADPYGSVYGNIRYADVKFTAEAGGHYRIDAKYCCGFYLGEFDLTAVDEQSGREIAHTLPASQVRVTGP